MQNNVVVTLQSKNERIKIDCDAKTAHVEVKGIAYCGGGRGICEVEPLLMFLACFEGVA